MIQDILTYLTLAFAIVFLVKKFFFKKKKTNKNCGEDCNCQ
ncbi:FeoB-associated Cys-rich membrane protein [Flavobacterium alvei]|uniref:FeoB-associated Cys-rich membrane protein n=1 Tax=Flavobacterium alvei TaxID=2080416 RepID=A0A2S5AB46_9FLAO|nr:FeoB-associated Cys-rich membrane protein [Flavobacterium alvei]POY39811.1 FeoB-associated Cys-rich membrane protein [Flavobacterium alvei]HQE33572.1 FeoB-associated Cys-rich membrane protein [Flavobacterium alvei]HQF48190.1 FeoB-associated Cys-rich membrane protein [Flavobacterium alvei]HQK38727.1 FeoB-associated Cys-rich membrane protein [Flavobacterium alvei]